MKKYYLTCMYCEKEYEVSSQKYSQSRYDFKAKNKKYYCSKECRIAARGHKVIEPVICTNCGKEFLPTFNVKSRAKSNNRFCSSSCAATYNNTHKTVGTRRSKLEEWIEKKLISLYPNLDILFNDKSVINSELDIYIPSLKLAFELNGIFHYEPIFGESKLNKIQENDNNKFLKCQEKNISLCIIDTSSQKYFKEKTSQKFLDIITEIIGKVAQSVVAQH